MCVCLFILVEGTATKIVIMFEKDFKEEAHDKVLIYKRYSFVKRNEMSFEHQSCSDRSSTMQNEKHFTNVDHAINENHPQNTGGGQ